MFTEIDPSSFSLLQYTIFATFVIAFLGMAAGSLFFFAEKNSVPVQYRSIMTVSGIILFIAAVNYFFMTGLYASGLREGEEDFVTVYRYVDWILTTPLMLLKFPLILGLGPQGRSFMIKLIGLDLIMITAGFFGELTIDTPVLHFGLFGLGGFCWLIILALLWKAMSSLPESVPDSIRSGARAMFLFILIGWSIYPLGYILPSFGLSLEIKNLVYNVGDVINKVGLAIVVYVAVGAAVQRGNAD